MSIYNRDCLLKYLEIKERIGMVKEMIIDGEGYLRESVMD